MVRKISTKSDKVGIVRVQRYMVDVQVGVNIDTRSNRNVRLREMPRWRSDTGEFNSP